jgi:twitching motility protein PilI
MVNRVALRELQTRLADRLRSTSAEGMVVSWLAVRSGGYNCLLPLTQSGEIFPIGNLQEVPYCHPWFGGVLNLRGGLFGVVDLAAFMAADKTLARRELTPEASVVTLHPALEVNCALWVDGLAGLRSTSAFPQSEPPASGMPNYYGNRYTDIQGEQWQEINLQSLSQFMPFLSICI